MDKYYSLVSLQPLQIATDVFVNIDGLNNSQLDDLALNDIDEISHGYETVVVSSKYR